MFFIRKLVATLISPSLLVVVVLVAGVAMLFFERTRRLGRWMVSGGVGALLLLSWGVPFEPVGRWLEVSHPAIVDPAVVVELEGVEWVVVLGGGHRAEAFLPVTAHANESSIFRIVEGVRLHDALPESRMLFTGWGGRGRQTSAAVGAEIAVAVGADPGRVVVDGQPRTTGEEALAVADRVGEGPVVLVTSAVHMPRSVRLFESAGVQVIPAPTGHAAFDRRRTLGDWIVPDPRRLWYADRVVHELAGLAVAGRRG